MKTLAFLGGLLVPALLVPTVLANTPPRITAPASVAVPEDTPSLEIPLQVADAETPPEALQLRLQVVPQNLVVSNGAVLGGA